jgi:hypothetical protein
MNDTFFLEKKEYEHFLYKSIRDNQKLEDVKHQIEIFWNKYKDFISNYQNKFLIKSQRDEYFYQSWWELILGVGLLNCGIKLIKKNNEKGPDIIIDSFPKINIEAIAPKKGINEDKLEDIIIDNIDNISMHTLPKKQFLLRLTSAFVEKYNKCCEYIKNKIISDTEPFIISICNCDLSEYGDLMNYPCNVIFSILSGAGNLVLCKDGNFIKYQEKIQKSNESEVDTNYFLKDEYKIISGVIYFSSNILNCPDNPENKFILIKNPKAKNIIPEKIFNIETWDFEISKSTWEKIL